MAIKDHFGHPKGLIGRLMLSGMNMGHSPMAKWAFAQIEVPADGRIVDIGCGGGLNIKRLLARSARGFVYGVDISEASVRKSKTVNQKEIGSRCEVYQDSADHLPFNDASIDLATAFETVYFWPDLKKCFAEVRRVLKPGCRFAVINDPGDPEKHWEEMIPGMRAYSPEEIEACMRDAGFCDIRIKRHKYMFSVIGTRQE